MSIFAKESTKRNAMTEQPMNYRSSVHPKNCLEIDYDETNERKRNQG